MMDHPGLVWLDDLRAPAPHGGHVNARWFGSGELPEAVAGWYRKRLVDHVERADGEWVLDSGGERVRLCHTVRVRSADDLGDGPRPQRALPPEVLTVIVDETALLPRADGRCS